MADIAGRPVVRGCPGGRSGWRSWSSPSSSRPPSPMSAPTRRSCRRRSASPGMGWSRTRRTATSITADPVTGAARAIVADAAYDTEPLWTRDGTRPAVRAEGRGQTGPGYVERVNVDGSGLRRITPEPMTDLRWYELAPDGGSVLILSRSMVSTRSRWRTPTAPGFGRCRRQARSGRSNSCPPTARSDCS